MDAEKVYLRPITSADTAKIVAWRNQDFVRKNFIYQQPFTEEGHTAWLREQVEPGHVAQFIICVAAGDGLQKDDAAARNSGTRDEGRAEGACREIGSVYLRDIDREKGEAEYGIFIGESDALGCGYGTQAAERMLEYGFGTLGLKKIFLRLLKDNIKALRSYEKAGFQRIDDRRENVLLEQGARDIIFMEIDRPAWEVNMKQLVSFVIPCYCSAQTIGGVVREIRETMEKHSQYRYEIVLVNDASPDDTFETIRLLCRENRDVCGINLARNFGQHAALMAGFSHARGDIVVCLDDDGQTPASEVGRLLAGIEAGSDVVYAKYTKKQHSGFRNFGSKINEVMTRVMLGKPKDLYLSSYFAAKRFVVEEMLRYENPYPYVIGLVLRTTKKISNVEVTHRERAAGTSGYTVGKLLGLWFNGFTAFSVKPLRLATVIGTLSACAGFLYGIYTIVKKFINPAVPVGFSALMAVIVFFCGLILLMLGIIGEYIGRIYISLNNSPQYVIRECVDEREAE